MRGKGELFWVAANEYSCTQEPKKTLAFSSEKIFLMSSPARTGEGELQQLIQLQRSRLRPTELLNVDTVLEEVIQALVTKPLRWAPSFFYRNNCILLIILRLQLYHVEFKLTNASETAPLLFTYSRAAILNKTWKPY